MSITLELPHELSTELTAEAETFGLSVTAYVLQIIAGRQVIPYAPQTGTELLHYWRSEQLIGTRAEINDSQSYARQLRGEAETRLRQ